MIKMITGVGMIRIRMIITEIEEPGIVIGMIGMGIMIKMITGIGMIKTGIEEPGIIIGMTGIRIMIK